jgi:hypothetical protein
MKQAWGERMFGLADIVIMIIVIDMNARLLDVRKLKNGVGVGAGGRI